MHSYLTLSHKMLNSYRYQLPVQDLPFDAGFFAVPDLFLHKLAVFQGHHGLRGQQERDNA